MRIRRLAAVGVSCVVTTVLLGGGRVAAVGAGCGGWAVEPSPTPGHANAFSDVAVVPGTDLVWAVGHFHSNPLLADQTLTELWDGTRWRHVPSPSLGQDTHDNNYLLGVAAISPTDAWAVGYRSSSDGEHTLTLH